MQDSELPPTTRLSGGGHGRWQAPSVAELQAMLPQYEILHLLGQGGMGAVYQGRQKSLRRTVAIKVLPPALAEDDLRGAERFRHEAYALAQMSHPRIVAVYDFGETPEGQLYFVMEFVDGTDVGQILQSSGRLGADHALKIAAQVCDALAYAHARGVIHRDIKPANVLLDRQGQVKVADFGLAKLDDPALTHALTRSNTAMGTPDYVAPESLIPGRVADHRADLYAVGVMLYQMLTGEVPRGMFKLPSQKVPEVDIRIDAIICKAMEQDREDRYQTAEVLQKDLDEVLTKPLLKQEPALPSVAQPAAKSNKKLVLGAIAAAIAAAAVWGWVGFHGAKSSMGAPNTGLSQQAPRGRVIDLLALVDVQRDAVAGEWSRKGHELVVRNEGLAAAGGAPRLQLPYRPHGEYDFEVEFTSAPGNSRLGQMLSVNSRAFGWLLSEDPNKRRIAGFGFLDQMPTTRLTETSALIDLDLNDGRRHRSRVEVRTGSLRGYVDDKLIVDWSGDFRRLGTDSISKLRDNEHLGLRTGGGYVFHAIQVREVTGTGVLDAAVPAAPERRTSSARVGAGQELPPNIKDWQDVTETVREKARNTPGLEVKEGAIHRVSSGSSLPILLTPPEQRDYAVRVRYNNQVQIDLRTKPEGGFLFVLSQENQTLCNRYLPNAPDAEILSKVAHPKDFDPSLEHELVVVMEGSQIRAWLDGRLAAEAQDGTFKEGGAALRFVARSVVHSVELGELPVTAGLTARPGATSSPQSAEALPTLSNWQDVTETMRTKALKSAELMIEPGAVRHKGSGKPISMKLTHDGACDYAVRVRYIGEVQVGLRWNPGGSYYVLSQRRQMFFHRHQEGVTDPAALIPDRAQPSGHDPDQPHELLVIMQGSNLRAWLDGRFVATARDGTFPDGTAGLTFTQGSAVQKVEVAELFADDAKKEEKPEAPVAGRAVDLLALIDVSRDPIRGTWTRSSRGVSVAPQSGVTVLELPYQPPEEYDFEVEFTPDNDGMNVNQYLSADGQSFAWKMNSHNIVPPLYGFELLDGRFAKDLREAATQLEAAIEKGKRYRSTIEVRRGSLRALLDGKELVRWSGDFNRFSMEDHSRLRNELHLGIGSWKRAVTFHKIQVTEISGKGRVDAKGKAAESWQDWLGPRLASGELRDSGWVTEPEGITTDHWLHGQAVLPAGTRDGAIRLTYVLRNSEGGSITIRHQGEEPNRKFYTAYDTGTVLFISRADGAEQPRLVSEAIPPEIQQQAERVLEFRFEGPRLTATLNGAFVISATDSTLREGECAAVLNKGALLKKVETLVLKAPKVSPVNDSFMKMIARVNGPRQVEIIGEKLEELNGVKPLLVPTIVSGKVTGLTVRTSDPTITDISPIAALRHLTVLSTDNNKVTDISCLAGLPLTELECNPDIKLDAALLRSIPTLKIFNKKPVAELLPQGVPNSALE